MPYKSRNDGRDWDKPRQAGACLGCAGSIKRTSRDKNGQAAPVRDEQGQESSLSQLVPSWSYFFLFIPAGSFIVPVFPHFVPACPCLSLCCPWIYAAYLVNCWFFWLNIYWNIFFVTSWRCQPTCLFFVVLVFNTSIDLCVAKLNISDMGGGGVCGFQFLLTKIVTPAFLADICVEPVVFVCFVSVTGKGALTCWHLLLMTILPSWQHPDTGWLL